MYIKKRMGPDIEERRKHLVFRNEVKLLIDTYS